MLKVYTYACMGTMLGGFRIRKLKIIRISFVNSRTARLGMHSTLPTVLPRSTLSDPVGLPLVSTLDSCDIPNFQSMIPQCYKDWGQEA